MKRLSAPFHALLLALCLCLLPLPAAAFTIDGNDGAAVASGPIKAAFDGACAAPRDATLLVLPRAVEANDRGNIVMVSLPDGVPRADVKEIVVAETDEGERTVSSVSIRTRGGRVLAAERHAEVYRCVVRETDPGTISFRCESSVARTAPSAPRIVEVAVRTRPADSSGTEFASSSAPMLLSRRAKPGLSE